MKSNVYAVRDNLCGFYLPPTIGDNDAAMVRAFGDVATKGGTPIGDHPEDYTLEKIGEFDNESGVLVALPTPQVLCHASDFVKKPIPENKE